MSNVVRLLNGGTIQVRTGVLQGIGPQGPRGPVGPQGVGDPGPQGLTGPPGAITQISAKAIAGVQPLTANTDTQAGFATVSYDDMSVFTSSANFTLPSAGDYLVTVWVCFADPGSASGYRQLRLNSALTGDLAFDQRNPVVGYQTYSSISYVHRCTQVGEVLRLFARSSQALNITAGALAFTRTGAGQPGPVGPTGPQGPVGPQGVQGQQGPAGSAGSGYATYNALKGS